MSIVRSQRLLLAAFLVFSSAGLSTFAADKPKSSEVVQQLADAERAFAKMSVERGIREAFLANFADDGLEFTPKPENAKELYGKRPAEPKPAKYTLDWSPEFTDVAASGDLGYNTGPYYFAVLDPKDPKDTKKYWGQFFSMWRKQADGQWKVAIDFGVDTPAPSSEQWPKHWAAEGGRYRAKNVDLTQERASLLNIDRELSRTSAEKGIVAAYATISDPSLRLFREKSFPNVGQATAAKALGDAGYSAVVWTPADGVVSRSGDLGYTYGGCETSKGATLERCYYLHVWKRDVKGNWKLVADVQKAVKPEKE